MKSMELRWIGALCALGATLIWSGNFIVARLAPGVFPPVALAWHRWCLATVILLPMVWPHMRREWQVLMAHRRYLAVTSLVGVTLFNTLLYLAGSQTSALNMAIITTSFPVFIVLFSRIFLGQAVTPGKLLGMAGAVAGLVVVAVRGDLDILLGLRFYRGDVLVLIASMSFAAYTILVRRKPEGMGQLSFLGASFTLGLAMLTPWFLWETHANGLPAYSAQAFASIAYIGLGASLASYWLWTRAVALIGPVNAGFIYYTLPLMSGLEAYLILSEPVTWAHLVGGTLVIWGIVHASRH